ncbi:hypothetical protein [Nesterenkonia sp.]|uniref:hypothetical protein n=1 Tax=Nesterenkonia sp. TaxID=704201 RepID=UPI002618E596|nr:hypothetical protein [Nesterenkonia sp.]
MSLRYPQLGEKAYIQQLLNPGLTERGNEARCFVRVGTALQLRTEGRRMTVLDDLPLLKTPYPTQHPWYDLSPLLVNGCRALTPGSCGVAVDGNLVHFDFRIDTRDATPGEKRFIDGLPGDVLPEGERTPVCSMSGRAVGLLFKGSYIMIGHNAPETLDTYPNIGASFTVRRAS